MIKRRGKNSRASRTKRGPESFHELEESCAVKGEFGAATGVGGCRVREGVELGAREVVAVHGHEGREGWGGGVQRCVPGVEGVGDGEGEGCFS